MTECEECEYGNSLIIEKMQSQIKARDVLIEHITCWVVTDKYSKKEYNRICADLFK
jgi:hypothetical protein